MRALIRGISCRTTAFEPTSGTFANSVTAFILLKSYSLCIPEEEQEAISQLSLLPGDIS